MTEFTFAFDDIEMPYFLVVPDGHDGSAMAQLQVLLPGAHGMAAPAAYGWGPSLLEGDAIVLIPDLHRAGYDVEVVQALMAMVVEDYCIDPQQVGVLGSSSSGRFTAELAASSDGVVATMAIGIGGFAPAADTVRAVPLLAWTGDSDQAAVDSSVESWAEVNGCDREPSEQVEEEVTTFTYQGCDEPITYHVVSGMGHQVPGHGCPGGSSYCYETPSLDLLDAAAAFLEANALNAR